MCYQTVRQWDVFLFVLFSKIHKKDALFHLWRSSGSLQRGSRWKQLDRLRSFVTGRVRRDWLDWWINKRNQHGNDKRIKEKAIPANESKLPAGWSEVITERWAVLLRVNDERDAWVCVRVCVSCNFSCTTLKAPEVSQADRRQGGAAAVDLKMR